MSDDTTTKSTIEAEFAKLSGYVSDVPYYRFPPAGSDQGLEFHRFLGREQAELERKFGFTADESYQQYSTYVCDIDDFFEYKTAFDIEREEAALLNHNETNQPVKVKKKISLADYKKKKETSSKPSPEEVFESRPSTASSPALSTVPSFVDINIRSQEAVIDIMATHAKKHSAKSHSHGLPPMLSPIAAHSNFELPPMLSPTLPPLIAKFLDRKDQGHPSLLVTIKYSSKLAKKIASILDKPRKRRLSSSEDESEDESTPKKVKTASPTGSFPAAATPSNRHMSSLSATPPLPELAGPSLASSSNKGITAELRQLAIKHNTLGRELKHISQRHVETTDTERILRAVTFLDSVMSYMLAYSYEDERQARSGMPLEYAKTWSTLIPFAQIRIPGDLPELDGVHNYLLYVIHNRTIELALKSGSSGSGVTHEENGASRPGHERTKLDAQLPILFSNANKYLSKAYRTLHPDEMRSRLPATWAGRTKFLSSSGKLRSRRGEEDLLASGGKKGPYILPIDTLTTPAEAVRFAAAALKEWLSSKKVDYELRSVATSM